MKLILAGMAALVIGASANAAVCAPDWVAGTVYTGGKSASYAGRNYTAKWWTQGEIPSASGQWGVWADAGACGVAAPTLTPQVQPTATPTSTVKPSASPSPTVKPTATPVPTAKPTLAPTAKPTATPSPTAKPSATPVPTATPSPTVAPTPSPSPSASPAPTLAPTTQLKRHVFTFSNDPDVRGYAGRFVTSANSRPSVGDMNPIPSPGVFFEFVKNDGTSIFTIVGSTTSIVDLGFSNGLLDLRGSGLNNIQTHYPIYYGMNSSAQIDFGLKDTDYIGVEITKSISEPSLRIRKNGAVVLTAMIDWIASAPNVYINTSVNCTLAAGASGCGAEVFAPKLDTVVTDEFVKANPDFLHNLTNAPKPPTVPPSQGIQRHQFWFSNNAPSMVERAAEGKFLPYEKTPAMGVYDPMPIAKNGTFFEFIRNDADTGFYFVSKSKYPRMDAELNFSLTSRTGGVVALGPDFTNIITNYPVTKSYGDLNLIQAGFKDSDYVGVELVRFDNTSELTIRRNGKVEIKATLLGASKNSGDIYLDNLQSCSRKVDGCGAVVYSPFIGSPYSDMMVTDTFLQSNPNFFMTLRQPVLPQPPL